MPDPKKGFDGTNSEWILRRKVVFFYFYLHDMLAQNAHAISCSWHKYHLYC